MQYTQLQLVAIPTQDDIPRLVQTHLHLPFANQEVWDYSERAAEAALSRYLAHNREMLDKLEHVEKNIELKLSDGIVVNGRIDLIRHTDTGHTVIVDFKSSDRAQAEDITRQQLQVYALGYQQLTGQPADLIEVHNLDDDGVDRELINPGMIQETIGRVENAGRSLRANQLPRLSDWCGVCEKCSMVGICRKH